MNLGIRKYTFAELFGAVPNRPPAGGVVDIDYDFTALNEILPHPAGLQKLYTHDSETIM